MSEIKKVLRDINNSFDEFKDRHSQENRDLQERMDELELENNRQGLGASSTKKMDAKDREYKNAFMSYLIKGKDALPGDLRNSLSVGSAPDGGFWVPASITKQIITKVHEKSDVRQLATVETISTDRLEIPKDIDEGTTGGWVGETQTRSDTATPEVGIHEIPLHEQYSMPKATQKVLDTIDLEKAESWLVDKSTNKISKDENTAFVTGNGVAKPRGFTDYAVSTDEDSSRAWGTMQYVPSGSSGAFKASGSGPANCLKNVVFKLQEPYHKNATWAMNRFTMAAIATLRDSNDNYLLGTARLQDQTPFELMGYPVRLMPDMPSIAANSLSIVFGDFKTAYRVVDHKKGISILRDPFTDKPFVRFYCTKFCGGAIVNSEALKFVRFSAS